MPQERNVLTERFWTVRVIRDFWYKGVWRQTGEQIHMPPHVARGQIEAGNVLQVNWPKATTDIPWALQSVGAQSGGGGAGVSSINGIEGDVSIVAGPNIVVTTGPSSITVGAPNVVPTSRQIIAGAGLSGGGALTGNVTLTANVQSVFGRTGAITAQAGDYTAGQITITPAIGTSGWTNVYTALQSIYNTLSSGAMGFWQAAASPAGAIYYNAGRVGVGTATPTVSLDVLGPWATGVEGPAKITSTGPTCYLTLNTTTAPGYAAVMFMSGGVYGSEIGYNASNKQIQVFDQSGQTIASMVIDMAGLNNSMVGINKNVPAYTLDVGGECNITTPTGSYRINGTPGLWGTFDVISVGGVLTEWEFEGGILTSYEEKSGTPLGLVIVSATAPPSPPIGQLWWDTTNLRLMIWNGVWIQAG